MIRPKLIILSVILACFMISSMGLEVLAVDIKDGVKININGRRLSTELSPVILRGTTFVPVRAVFEKIGAKVSWVDGENKVILTHKNKAVELSINNLEVKINQRKSQLPGAPFIRKGRTFVPIRYIAEALGMKVGWYGPSSLVTVTDPLYFNLQAYKTVLGYTTNDYPGDHYSHRSLLENYKSLNMIAAFAYQVTKEGNLILTGKSQKNTVDFANEKNVTPLVLIHNMLDHSFNSDLAHGLLSTQKNRKKIIDQLLLILAKDQYGGVNIDLENIKSSDRAYYSEFVKEVKTRLAPYGYLTTVAIPAKTSDSIGSKWSGAYDYKVIGKYADKVLLMTYDEHYFGGPAGPISSAPWVEKVLQYATSTMPSEKILLGIPGYGYDWSKEKTKVVTFQGVQKVLDAKLVTPQWDDLSKSPFYQYVTDGIEHTVWYENSESIEYKLELAKKHRLGGIGIWKLGYDNSYFWSVLNSHFSPYI